MTAWVTIRRFGVALVLVACAFAPSVRAADPSPRPTKPSPAQLREIAERAEKAGDWDAAFTAYCHLFVADRNSPELREKLNAALRRVQQVRRHRDPNFQQFATAMPLASGLDLFAEVIQRVPSIYADREKATAQTLWGFAVEEVDRALGNSAFRQAFLDNTRADKIEPFRAALRRDWAKRPVADYKTARAAMRELIAAAQDAFPVRVPAALALEAACGSCSGLDEYTAFLTPNAGGAPAGPDLAAAGLFLGANKDGLFVQGVIPNSWVAHNYPHLQRGDRVVKINGRPMDNMAGAVEALKHPGVDGNHRFEFPPVGDGPPIVVAVPVSAPTVYGRKLLSAKDVGYLRLGTFSPATPGELDTEIIKLKTDGARVVILDLRGNHGGSFLAGVEVARRLLPDGIIVTTQGQAAEVHDQTFTSMSGMSAHDIKVVLLIDAETASAAEVLAAALKDNNRATLVGMPTFGKGTVQYPLRLMTLDEADPKKPGKTGTVRVTIAKLIAPRSGPINGVGVTPHHPEADFDRQPELATEKAIELIDRMMPQMQLPPPPVSPVPAEPNLVP
ncbi:MAG: hypothetical protein FJ304_23345 [Planctomycetes bacterium]|nr:hypothetical protein [Planctomycetota bacterium]